MPSRRRGYSAHPPQGTPSTQPYQKPEVLNLPGNTSALNPELPSYQPKASEDEVPWPVHWIRQFEHRFALRGHQGEKEFGV